MITKIKQKWEELCEKGFLTLISSRIFFCFYFTVVIWHLNLRLSETFLSQETYYLKFQWKTFPIAMTPESAESFRTCYYLLTLVAAVCVAIIVYRSVVERILPAEDLKIKEKRVKVCLPEFPYRADELKLVLGLKHNKYNTDEIRHPEYLVIPETAIYQNFIVTGGIGTGKTASVMYPLLKQIMFYQSDKLDKKAGLLVLDVKGNFYKQLLEYAEACGREKDVVLIELDGQHTYNPVHKPELEPIDLASRSRSVMNLFGDGKKESFWDTKAQQMMTEAIKLLRMTDDDGYITLADISNVIMDNSFLNKRLERLFELQNVLPQFDFDSCVRYFSGEFASKAETTIATIKSCVTEMTGFFSASERIHKAFCPAKEDLTFTGFQSLINDGKIVVLNIAVAKYPQVSKTIAAYLKLDFQSEVQQRTSNPNLNKTRPVFFMSDEYQEFVTENDARFYGIARESKCCSIVSSQSYTSLLLTLKNKDALETILLNLVNKIWLRTDDKLTIDKAQLLTGREEKERYSKNISESMSDVKQSKIFGRLVSDKTSMSESINVSLQKDFVFETNIFTQTLKAFKAIAYTADGEGMCEPYLVHLMPYFKAPIIKIRAPNNKKMIIKMKK